MLLLVFYSDTLAIIIGHTPELAYHTTTKCFIGIPMHLEASLRNVAVRLRLHILYFSHGFAVVCKQIVTIQMR